MPTARLTFDLIGVGEARLEFPTLHRSARDEFNQPLRAIMCAPAASAYRRVRHEMLVIDTFFCLSARGLTQTRHPLAESAPVCLNAELYEIRGFQKRGDQTQTYDLLEIVYTPGTITSVFPRQLNFRVTLTPLLEIADQIEFYAPAFQATEASFLDGEASQPLEIQMGNDGMIRVFLDAPLDADSPIQLQMVGRLNLRLFARPKHMYSRRRLPTSRNCRMVPDECLPSDG